MTVRMTSDEAALVTSRAGVACERCGNAPWQQLHHRRARGSGGTSRDDVHAASNLLAVCEPCHRWIESHPAFAREAGWIVSQWSAPADIAVERRGTVVLLDDEGGWLRLDEFRPTAADIYDQERAESEGAWT